MNYFINVINGTSTPHRHKQHYEIIVYLSGNSLFCTEQGQFPVSPGNIVIVPPDTIHYSPPGNNPERIYINGEFNQIFNLHSPIIITDTKDREGTTLAQMIYKNRYGNPEYISALCNTFAHFLLQSINFDDNISLTVKELISEITDNFHDTNLSLSYILNKSGYAEDYIRAHFKKITGKTPTEFLTSIRIRHACYLIDVYKNTLPLSQIAEKCGFTDYIYFSRRFKQFTGISPQNYHKST